MSEKPSEGLKTGQDLHNILAEFIKEWASRIDAEGQEWKSILDRHPQVGHTEAGVSALSVNYGNKEVLRDLAGRLLLHDHPELLDDLDEPLEDTTE